MKSNRNYTTQLLALALVLLFAPAAFAQDGASSTANNSTNTQTVANNQKLKIKGVVTSRDSEGFTIRDASSVETRVLLTDRTSVKTKGGFLSSGTNYATTQILRGLNLEVEGRGDASGNLVATKVRFNESDYRVAQTVESRVNPVENRVGETEQRVSQVEQNAQRMSGQIDELAAVSNAAKGGAKAAQETADAAVAGVNATNERISALDEYEAQESRAILFRTGSAVLNQEAKAALDELARKAEQAKGYLVEISGYTDASGSVSRNRRLSQQRADAVVRYLVENHNIPLRRIITPFGYGEAKAVSDNRTREGRAENRRVEVKFLVSKGLVQPTPDMSTSSVSQSNTNP
ncbi:MAG TPA: OmpA family protein [Pyrinomonadaceae bacterium]|nr:OmpA family protein [Pyrinomonadaceae bacterium]